MSGFDDNPFGDPDKDPFGPQNPFGSPVTQTTTRPSGAPPVPSSTVQVGGLDNFNPFEDSNRMTHPPQPAVLPASEAPPSYTAVTSTQRVTTEELERRQRDLESRAAELQRREDEARWREEQQKSSGGGGSRQNNWPPLPSFMPCGPCFYQDFETDIPVEFRRIVKIGYYLWLAHVTTFFLNVLGTLAYFIGDDASSESGTTFGMSILLLIIFVPATFVCWYRPLYKAFKSDSSFNFFMFFFVFFIQIILLMIQALGINWLASCGWLNSIRLVSKGYSTPRGAGGFMMIIAIMFTALFIADGLLLVRVHRIYRSTGASFEKAKQEFSHGVATNAAVRGAAADVGAATVRGAVSGGNRY